jgi:hypothetical protein
MATRTTRFGVSRREAHDSSPFYDRAVKQVAARPEGLSSGAARP